MLLRMVRLQPFPLNSEQDPCSSYLFELTLQVTGQFCDIVHFKAVYKKNKKLQNLFLDASRLFSGTVNTIIHDINVYGID